MKQVWTDRRLFCALVGMACLLTLGLIKEIDTSSAIAAVCMAVAAANAGEKVFKKKE